MMQFQVGDVVRVIQESWTGVYGRVGDIGTATSLMSDHTVVVDGVGDREDDDGSRSCRHRTPGWAVDTDHLELVCRPGDTADSESLQDRLNEANDKIQDLESRNDGLCEINAEIEAAYQQAQSKLARIEIAYVGAGQLVDESDTQKALRAAFACMSLIGLVLSEDE